MRNTYSNPVINIEQFDFENIVTTSGNTVKTANEKATDALLEKGVVITNIMTLGE